MDQSTHDIAEKLGLNAAARRGRPRKLLLAAGALALVVLLVVMAGFRGNSTAPRYTTGQAKRGSMTVSISATGTLQPTNTVSVGCELSGIMKTVEVTYNDRVQVGQVLARLDSSKLEAQVTQSKSALESAKAKLLQTQATVVEAKAKLKKYKKVLELSGGKVPSQTEMDVAEASYARAKADAASAQADVSQARATLQVNETDIAKSVIHSPINGVVLTRSIEPGQTVAAVMQTPVLFTLAEDLTQMQLHVNVDEADIGKVRPGQQAIFRVAAYANHDFKGQIVQARYGATTTSGVVTYETILDVDNTELLLRPGMTATADIVVKQVDDALLVPSASLRFSPPAEQQPAPSGGLLMSLLPRPPQPKHQQPAAAKAHGRQRVWILKDNLPSPVPVTTGEASSGYTEIIAGDVEAGMDVVLDTAETGQ